MFWLNKKLYDIKKMQPVLSSGFNIVYCEFQSPSVVRGSDFIFSISPPLCPESRLDVPISTANKVYLPLLQPYLSVMLNKGSLEVLMFTGSQSPRRVIRRPEHGALNDGREHSLRIERLAGRSASRLCLCT